jgi:hypothetical protein
VAAVALVVATAPAAYVVMPDQSTTHDPHPDYYLRPPAIAHRTILTIGLVALTVAVIAGVTLVMARRAHAVGPRLVGVTTPLVAVGARPAGRSHRS